MSEEILKKIEEQGVKIDAMYASVERLRKYFMWTLVITVATVVLPLMALAFVLPWFAGTMTAAYGIG